MGAADFFAALRREATAVAPQYGLDPTELLHTMIMAAALEGGIGESPDVGDEGNSWGRFQFNFNGGVGASLLQQGIPREQIISDDFQARYWTPVVAGELAKVKQAGGSGVNAMAQAIFQAERPYRMYTPDRVAGANNSAAQISQGYYADGTGAAGGAMPGGGRALSMNETEYFEKRRRYLDLIKKVSPYFYEDGSLTEYAQQGLESRDPKIMQALAGMDPNLLAEMMSLNVELSMFEDERDAAGTSPDDIRQWYDFINKNDPRAIDAANAAEKYTREYQLRTEAGALAQNAVQAQLETVQTAGNQEADLAKRAANGEPRGGFRLAFPSRIKSGDELFQESYDRLKKNLPEFVPAPYPQMPPPPSATGGTRLPPAPPQTPVSTTGGILGLTEGGMNFPNGSPGAPAYDPSQPFGAPAQAPYQRPALSPPAGSGSLVSRFGWGSGRKPEMQPVAATQPAGGGGGGGSSINTRYGSIPLPDVGGTASRLTGNLFKRRRRLF